MLCRCPTQLCFTVAAQIFTTPLILHALLFRCVACPCSAIAFLLCSHRSCSQPLLSVALPSVASLSGSPPNHHLTTELTTSYAFPIDAVQLLNIAEPVSAFPPPLTALPCHCYTVRIKALPMHPTLYHCSHSPQSVTPAVPASPCFALPRHYSANFCICSVSPCSAIPWHIRSNQFAATAQLTIASPCSAIALRLLSLLCRCLTAPRLAPPKQFAATPCLCYSVLCHGRSNPCISAICRCRSVLCCSQPLPRFSYQIFAVPMLLISLLRHCKPAQGKCVTAPSLSFSFPPIAIARHIKSHLISSAL